MPRASNDTVKVVYSSADRHSALSMRELLRTLAVELVDVEDHAPIQLEKQQPSILVWSMKSAASADFQSAVEAAHDTYSLISVTTTRSVSMPVRFRSTCALTFDYLHLAPALATKHLLHQVSNARRQMLPKPVTKLSTDELHSVLSSGVDRHGLDLAHRNLAGLDLSNAYLNGANLLRTDLSNCTLTGASFVGANLERSRLTGAKLDGSDMSLANLWHTEMVGVSGLETCNLTHTNIFGIDYLTESVAHRSFSRGSYASYIQYLAVELGFTKSDIYECLPWLTHKYFEHLLM
jgi:hypothetical protein